MGKYNDSGNKDNSLFPRRRVLKSIGAGSALAIGASNLAVGKSVVPKSDDTIEIPIVKSGDNVLKWKEVPEEWWLHEKSVMNTVDELSEHYQDHEQIAGVGVGPSTESINSKHKSRLRVDVKPGATDSSSISVPESVNDIPVEIREKPQIELHDCSSDNCDTKKYENVMGGVRLDRSHSSTCMVSYDGTQHYIMCSAHAVGGCDSEPSGPVWQEGQVVGDLVEYDAEQDWAIMEVRDLSFLSSRIAGSERRIAGHTTQAALHDIMSEWTTVYHRGFKTCTTDGRVAGYGRDLRDSFEREGCDGEGIYVETNTCTYPGDSGGPHYHTWTEDGCEWAAIIAIHKGGTTGQGYSTGCAAYEIVDEHPIEFPSPPENHPC